MTLGVKAITRSTVHAKNSNRRSHHSKANRITASSFGTAIRKAGEVGEAAGKVGMLAGAVTGNAPLAAASAGLVAASDTAQIAGKSIRKAHKGLRKGDRVQTAVEMADVFS